MSLTTPLAFPEPPFQDTLDPKFVFLSPTHEALLRELLDLIQRRQGLALVVGEEGVGKTTLISVLVDRLPPTCQAVVMSPPGQEPLRLVHMVASALGLAFSDLGGVDLTAFAEALRHSVQASKKPVAIVDDAQDLSDGHLREIWLMSQIESPDGVLLPFILVGRRGLLKKVDSRTHERLQPLIRARLTLPPLTPKETIQYLDHRLRQVGSSFSTCFTSECSGPLFATTGGIPRLINQRAREALVRGQREGLPRVTRAQFSAEGPALLPPEELPFKSRHRRRRLITATAILTFLGMSFALYQGWHGRLFPWASVYLRPLLERSGGINTKPESPKPAKAVPAMKPLEAGKSESALSSLESERQSVPSEAASVDSPAAKTPETPLATYQVAPSDHLFKIAAKIFPDQPRLGVAALILANPDLNEEDILYPGQVLRVPRLESSQGIIQVNGKYFYLMRRFFGNTMELSRLLDKLKEMQVQFLVRETTHPQFRKIYRLFIGGYATPEELQKAMAQVGVN